MNKQSGNILFLVNGFLDETGMGPSYFGKKSVGNSEQRITTKNSASEALAAGGWGWENELSSNGVGN